ncbi:MAG: pyridoxal phosphate-dependent aminotransferase [Methyloligellaceae bacterium]
MGLGSMTGVSGLLSNRSQIDSFIVMDLMAQAAQLESQGKDIVHMEVGQPGTPAPKSALLAAENAMKSDKLGYTLALGMEPLRERIAEYYKQKYAVSVSPERIIITTGSSAGFILSFLSCFDQGQNVALTRPGYPCYRQIMKTLGITPVDLPLSSEERWMPTASMLENAILSEGVKGVILASPANPTGTMLEEERLASLIDVSVRNRSWFISDEIYHGLTYDADDTTALKFSDDVIVINSFSKYFSMTGWRVGWMVVPENSIRTFERLAQNMFISVPTISQFAALGAFDGQEELEQYKSQYRKNRELLLNEFPGAGITEILPADGAFYLYADVSKYTDNSLEFCNKMLREAGVAATPGIDFDPVNGKRYVRFSYAGTYADMQKAAQRLGEWL